jgi:phenylacetate-CoA ligase
MSGYSSLLRSLILPAYDAVRGREYSKRHRFLERSQWWDRNTVTAFQWTELQRLLKHAFDSVPYLQSKYRAARIELADIRTWQDFRLVPPLTREEVNAHGCDLCSTTYRGKLLPHATGGSSGTPTRFFRTYESYDWRTAAKDRTYGWSGWKVGERSIYLWGAPVGKVSRRQRRKARAYEWVHRQRIFNTFIQTDELWARVLKEIGAYKPAIVVGYVSSLEQFARFIDRSGAEVAGVKAVIAAAEPLYQASREQISRSLRAPVFNTYGSREFMSIGGECSAHHGLHVNVENLVVETVDASAIDPSEILITDLHNFGMPFIRYATGDSGRLTEETCPCGRGLPLLDSIEGRVLDLLRAADGRIVPGEFFPHLLKDVPEFAQYRVEQKSLDRIVITAVLTANLSERSYGLLRSEIQKVFGSNMQWDIQAVDQIPALQSGKRRVTVGLGR